MQTINAMTITQSVNKWLEETRQPRILHIFENACNLINESGGVLSIVTKDIGNGPFNMVLDRNIDFVQKLNLQSPVSVISSQLQLGDMAIHTADAKLWNPRPGWDRLYSFKNRILNRVNDYLKLSGFDTSLENHSGLLNHQLPIPQFSKSLLQVDIQVISALTPKFAGLGSGLTPAGDDFLMGAMYATWIIHPTEVASKLGNEIAETAAPLITSLSGAWIRSAAKGEAGQVWHEFLDALIDGDQTAIQLRVENILAVGETSGADALAGFLNTVQAYMASFSRNAATSSTE